MAPISIQKGIDTALDMHGADVIMDLQQTNFVELSPNTMQKAMNYAFNKEMGIENQTTRIIDRENSTNQRRGL